MLDDNYKDLIYTSLVKWLQAIYTERYVFNNKNLTKFYNKSKRTVYNILYSLTLLSFLHICMYVIWQ